MYGTAPGGVGTDAITRAASARARARLWLNTGGLMMAEVAAAAGSGVFVLDPLQPAAHSVKTDITAIADHIFGFIVDSTVMLALGFRESDP